MKRDLSCLKNRNKEREKILENFYTKQMKNGKTNRADFFDKIFLSISVFLIISIVLYKLTANFIISLTLSSIIMFFMGKYMHKVVLNNRMKKIEEIKKEYKIKLEEERVLDPSEDIEDYIIGRYYEKKSEVKKGFNFFSKDKIVKLYLLFIVFYITSYFSTYPVYYKIMATVSFIMASVIGSYNITEYIKNKDKKDLLNRDIDV